MVFTFLRIFILKSMAQLYNKSVIDQYEGDIIIEVHAKLVWEQRDLMFKFASNRSEGRKRSTNWHFISK